MFCQLYLSPVCSWAAWRWEGLGLFAAGASRRGSSEAGGAGAFLHPLGDRPPADLVDSTFMMNESCANGKACDELEPLFWGHTGLGWISTAAVY